MIRNYLYHQLRKRKLQIELPLVIIANLAPIHELKSLSRIAQEKTKEKAVVAR